MKRIINKLSIALLAALVFTTGCKKEFLDTKPTDDVSGETIFQTTQGAYVALDGTYRNMWESLTNHGNFGQRAYDLTADLMGEDMVVHKQGYGWFNGEYNYSALQTAAADQRSDRTWYYYYTLINNANRILAAIDDVTGPDADKANIKGQALAIRANSYYYLVNFFQQTYKGNENKPGVPLYTEPTSEGKGRGTVQEVYNQIIADLTEAETLLEGAPRLHKSHINQKTVQGIRARVALVMEDWATAASYANKARQGMQPMPAAQYTTSGFNTLSNSEWIWGLEVNVEQATIFASFYSHVDANSGGYASLGTQKKITKALYDEMSDTDVRKDNFVALDEDTDNDWPPFNQTKFKLRQPGVWASDYLLMRASEMYLIEAEALARTGGDAASVLESLVQVRDPQYSATGLSGASLLEEIKLQRKIELWGEGFGLFDVKRYGEGLKRPLGAGNHNGSDLVPVKPGANFATSVVTLPANDPLFLMRIPQNELNSNNEMTPGDQNP